MISKNKKIRVDQLLVDQALAPTRTKAQSLIMAGLVYCGEVRIEKSSELFSSDTFLTVKQKEHPFVGRGGVKLQAALTHFKIDAADKICLDVGASTGGFTDCLLQSGAKKVYAVDVGHGQFDWKLRNNPRVVLYEKNNFRYFDVNLITEPVDIVVMDVSFISVKKLIPKVVEIFCRGEASSSASSRTMILLIKPQFEVGRAHVGKGGIVKDEKAKEECVKSIKQFCEENGFNIIGLIPSPLLGQDGNEEFLLALTKS